MNRKIFAGVVALVLVCGAGSLGAQSPLYVLSAAGPAQHGENDTAPFLISVTLANNGMPVSGWSYGVCNDTSISEATTILPSDTNTINGGQMPGFLQEVVQVGGFTQGVVIDLFGGNPILGGTTITAANVEYVLTTTPATNGFTDFAFCDTLGAVPVATVVVVAGLSAIPTQVSHTLEIVGLPDPAFDYIAPNQTVGYNPLDGLFGFTASFKVDQQNNGAPDAITQGFSMGLGHDSGQLSVTAAAATLPFTPAFATAATLANGWTIGVVYDLMGMQTLVLQDFSVVNATYENAAGAPLSGNLVGVTTNFTWSDLLGVPPVANVIVVGGSSVNASFVDGSVDLLPATVTDFRRGDANFDGIVNIADGIWILNDLFQSGPTTTGVGGCDAANNANGQGGIDASDATYIFLYRFLSGPTPPAPFPGCGTFPGQGDAPVDCDVYTGC